MCINKRILKSVLKFAFITMIFISITVMSGCSAKNIIVGTWLYTTDGEVKDYDTMYFYEDGTCLDTPVKTMTSAEAVSYKMQDDGMLIFTMEWDGTKTYKPADDKETALDNSKYYYLSDDTFILCGATYVRKWTKLRLW